MRFVLRTGLSRALFRGIQGFVVFRGFSCKSRGFIVVGDNRSGARNNHDNRYESQVSWFIVPTRGRSACLAS